MARAHTITTLQCVSQEHKSAIVRFLDESGFTCGDVPVLDLATVELA